MTPRDLEEYRALRGTIRQRGSVRTCVFVAGLGAWGLTTIAATVAAVPLLTVIPLAILAATFEAVFALHVGVERIGRYLQVFYEDRWEQTAMAFGAPAAGTSSDPLFIAIFGVATVCNFVPVIAAGPVRTELVALAGFHGLLFARFAVASRAAGRQRAADLERFLRIKQEGSR